MNECELKIGMGWVTYLFSYEMRDNDVGGGNGLGSGWLSLMKFWSSEKLSNFKVRKLSWTANEFCTYLIIDEKKNHLIFTKLVKNMRN